jgi:hypothetical protein
MGCAGPQQSPGRQRPLLVETLGRIGAGVVTAAKRAERLGWGALWQRSGASGVPRLRTIWGAGGEEAQWRGAWGRGVQPTPQVALAVVEHPGQGWQGVQHRWQVERTCAGWLQDRRHSRAYEGWTANSEATMQIRMIRLLLKRLA